VRFLKAGAHWFIEKPYDQEELLSRIFDACKQRRSSEKSLAQKLPLAPPLEAILTKTTSPAMQRAFDRARKAAKLQSTILLSGESGTGKSAFAKFIHECGPKRNAPFISVSCAAIPRELLESELFGHEKGAFTGAISQKLGAVELAEGGTLFLDEIGDLPLELQPKLLTFLQERRYRKVGGVREHLSHVRIITATHLDLRTLCKERKFREDLFYRLHVIQLQIPALRDRVEDIVPLAMQMLHSIANSRGQPPFTLSTASQRKLSTYAWPGNVRELENVLESATAFVEGETLHPHDITLPSDEDTSGNAPGPWPLQKYPSSVSRSETEIFTLVGRTLDEIERDALFQTLEACRWNKTMAATQLGISIKSIYNKMDRLGISEPAPGGREKV
jgi:DNA-binding NtrC family response regulator